MLTSDRDVEALRIKEALDFNLEKPERIISRSDITGSYIEEDNGGKSDVVLYKHQDRFFVTDEMIEPVHVEFHGPKYDVTKFMAQRKCFACLLGATEQCTCANLKIVH